MIATVDKLAQIIRTADGTHDMGAGALAQAIIDALPGLVKPLEWENQSFMLGLPGRDVEGQQAFSEAGVSYSVAGSQLWGSNTPTEDHPSDEAAKAAAQADYTRRILAAFGIAEESE